MATTTNTISAYVRGLSAADKQHYLSKLTLINGDQLPDPFLIESSEWSEDITKLPSLTWRDVTTYLIDTPSVFTKEAMKAYKSLEAYDYFVCGHVQDCRIHEISPKCDFCFVKSEVLPSQRQGQKSTLYSVWVCLNKKHGWVLTGNCTCMAGLGSVCSHVAALLFKLEAAVHFHFNDQNSCTSQLCSWKASRRCVNPSPAYAINFHRAQKRSLPQSKRASDAVPNHYCCTDPSSGTAAVSKSKLVELHKICPTAAVFTSLDVSKFVQKSNSKQRVISSEYSQGGSDTDTGDEDDGNCIPEPITSLFDPVAINMSDPELTTHARKLYKEYFLSYSQKSFTNLNQLTLKQAQSTVWMIHRAGRITASNCHEVSKMKDGNKSAINKIMQYNASFISKYTTYGKTMESRAKQNFYSEQLKLHKDFKIEESGLVVSAEAPYLGASPDGIVTCSCHGKGVLEIKCPYTYKNGFQGWQGDKNFPFDLNLIIKPDHKYYYQIQLQMELCGVHFGYFYIYTPAEKTGMLSTVERNGEFIEDLKRLLLGKFFKFILPEVVSRKNDASKRTANKLYCTCRRPEFGKMISCQSKHCNVVKYHYPCVNITRAPRHKWLCNSCR